MCTKAEGQRGKAVLETRKQTEGVKTLLGDPKKGIIKLSGLGITGDMDRDGRGGHCIHSNCLRMGDFIYTEVGQGRGLFSAINIATFYFPGDLPCTAELRFLSDLPGAPTILLDQSDPP
ncbi:MAG: hypothetical protein JRD02_12855 [Deltaproteobacteria bacterium]|nr:hypothetical protein [Deltaproteobacteria bacterium]